MSAAHLPLTPPLSAGLPMEGGSIFSGQLPRNYIVATPNGGYEQASQPVRYGDYSYAPMNYPPAGYSVGNQLQVYGPDKQERESYVCEDDGYGNTEDVKPTIVSTTSAFNVISAPPHYAVNSCVSREDEAIDGTSFHASTYSAFSPFASDNSSPVSQSPTPAAAHSPLL